MVNKQEFVELAIKQFTKEELASMYYEAFKLNDIYILKYGPIRVKQVSNTSI